MDTGCTCPVCQQAAASVVIAKIRPRGEFIGNNPHYSPNERATGKGTMLFSGFGDLKISISVYSVAVLPPHVLHSIAVIKFADFYGRTKRTSLQRDSCRKEKKKARQPTTNGHGE